MREPTVDDVVRLTRDIPHLNLHSGQTGIVRSLWFAPAKAYEVEFAAVGLDDRTRAVLLREQVVVEGDTIEREVVPEYIENPSAGVW